MKNPDYDVLIVGAGHAGIEAALAAARMGRSVLLLALDRANIGILSCNPAVGGVGKGQLVREIDALGGEMGKAADTAGIQFRTLNTSKGPAVRSTRVQVDRNRYRAHIRTVLEQQGNLDIAETEATGIIVENGRVTGMETGNGPVFASAVVLTPGTFFNGLIHNGMESFDGGRLEEQKTSRSLPETLKRLGFSFNRFKTGTCARLKGSTIIFDRLRPQHGDEPPPFFSRSTIRSDVPQLPCFVTYTHATTHDIIRQNLDRSPLFSGKITGTGVRYCPSLEDKVVKFPHHTRHHIFLEPETAEADTYYPNGLSTSLPPDVQDAFIRTIPGLEDVVIERYGYGIEHDVIDSRQLKPSLESVSLQGLFFAGQINGTTGYEEAAAQGLLAGINAALLVAKKEPLLLDRATSYLGVLVDDLVTRGTNEPYRMFTSRVEYRLLIREDNTDLRLTKYGAEIGLVPAGNYRKTVEKEREIKEALSHVRKTKVAWRDEKISAYQLLKHPEITVEGLKKLTTLPFADDIIEAARIEIRYETYIRRHLAQIEEFRNLEQVKIPNGFDYANVPGLSLEIREKLSRLRPVNLGQAGRISGVTPAALTILMAMMRRKTGERGRNKAG